MSGIRRTDYSRRDPDDAITRSQATSASGAFAELEAGEAGDVMFSPVLRDGLRHHLRRPSRLWSRTDGWSSRHDLLVEAVELALDDLLDDGGGLPEPSNWAR